MSSNRKKIRLGDRYLLKRMIGEGGMATVHLAVDEKLGRNVAVKLLHPHMEKSKDLRRRFFHEAKAISALEHANILKIYDFSGQTSKQMWIVTEIVKGHNLNEFIEKFTNGSINYYVSCSIIREVCKALEVSHMKNIVHRDIKPENVMITSKGGIKLMDFGIAKGVDQNSATQTGTFMGSPSYMSPEQVRGKHLDYHTDIYSLGVMFYELVTGRLPFSGNSTHDLIIKIAAGKFIEPNLINTKIPDEINNIILDLMSKNAIDRPDSIQAVGKNIDHFLASRGFVESHVELERYFKDRVSYEAKLAGKMEDERNNKLQSGFVGQSDLKSTLTKEPIVRENSVRTSTNVRKKHSAKDSANDSANDYRGHSKENGQNHRKSSSPRKPRKTPSLPPVVKPAPRPPTVVQRQPKTQIVHQEQFRQSGRHQRKRDKSVVARYKTSVRRSPVGSRPQRVAHRPANHVGVQKIFVKRYKTSFTQKIVGFLLVGIFVMLTVLGYKQLKLRMSPTPTRKTLVQTKKTLPKPTRKIPEFKKTKNIRYQTRKTSVLGSRKKIIAKPRQSPSIFSQETESMKAPGTTPRVAKPEKQALTKKASEEASPPAITSHYLVIKSSPPSKIFINDKPQGTTSDRVSASNKIKVSTGEIKIRLERKGYLPFERIIKVDRKKLYRLGPFVLEKAVQSLNKIEFRTNKPAIKLMVLNYQNSEKKLYRDIGDGFTLELENGSYEIQAFFGKQRIKRVLRLPNGFDVNAFTAEFK